MRLTVLPKYRDPAIFVAAVFAWLVFVHSVALPANDQMFPAFIALCIAYSLLMCKALSVAPLVRPFIAMLPTVIALCASWAVSRETGSFRHDRAILIAQSVTIAALAYLSLAVYRVGRGYFREATDWIDREYVLHTPDGGTDGFNTDRLFLDFENFRSRLVTRRKLKILFPNSEWEEWLRSSFGNTRDELTFAELSPENIRAHDLVVPLKIRELLELDGLRHLLAGNPIPVPSPGSIALCNDKYALNRTLIANGFVAFIPAMHDALGFPYILKKRSDEWALNSHVITNHEQERRHSGLLLDTDYFRQQFIPGKTEFTTHILMRGGAVVCALSMKFVFREELQVKGRDCVASYSKLCRNDHLDVFAAMLRSIGFEGLCCVNYKVVDGRPLLFEINPRFGASLVPWFFSFVRRMA